MASNLTEVFWVTFITLISGMVIKLASMCYKSKCKEFSFCCFKIVRDTAAEQEEEEQRIDHNIRSPDSSPSARNLNSTL